MPKYVPSQDLSIAIATTQLPRSANNGVEYAIGLFAELIAYLTQPVETLIWP